MPELLSWCPVVGLPVDLFELASVAALFGGYLALWSIKRRRQRRATGRDPEIMGRATDRLQRYFSSVTRALTLGVIALIALHALGRDDWWGLVRLAPLDQRWADWLGLATGLCGLLLCGVAQLTMGSSWRVGIDERQRTELVTGGIYAYLRNPTYLGLFLLCCGFWLIWPSCAVATWGLIFVFFLEIQVRCEEQHLLELHGETYRRYLALTWRYLPGLY